MIQDRSFLVFLG